MLLLLLAALPVAIAPVVAIMAGLLIFFALEWLTYPLLALAHRLRGRPGKVNPPVWELACIPSGSSPDPEAAFTLP